MQTTDEASGIHLVRATIHELEVMGVPASTFYVTATGSPEAAIEAVKQIAPPDWMLEVLENRLSVATVRRLNLSPGEARLLA